VSTPDALDTPTRTRAPHRRLVAAAIWLVATALAVLAFRAVGGRAALAAMRAAHAGWVAVAIGCHAAVIALWAAQTRLLLPRAARAPYLPLLEAQALGAAAGNTVPAFLGTATGVALLAGVRGVGLAPAVAVLAQHNVAEGIAKLATLGLAARVVALPAWMRQAVPALAVGVALLVVALVVAVRVARRRPDPSGRLARWTGALDGLRSPRFAGAVLLGLAMKGAEASGWMAVERALDVATRPGSAVLALAATNLASAVPITPGNLGVYESAAFGVYHGLLGVPRAQAVALGVVGHAAYLAAFVGLGWGWLTVRQLRRLGASARHAGAADATDRAR
jgi:uncharacterized membrane protein YbhN (UPF0104 family)